MGLTKEVEEAVTPYTAALLSCFVSRGVAQTLSRGHKGKVDILKIDPSGTFLFSGSETGECKVWRLGSGRLILDALLCADAGRSAVNCAFITGPLGISSPDTTATLFVAGADRHDNSLNSGIITCFQISEAATKHGVGRAALAVDYANKNRIFKLTGYIAPVACMELIGGEKIAACTEAGFIWIFTLSDLVKQDYSRCACMSTFYFSNVLALYIHAESSLLVAGTESGRISIWNTNRLKTLDLEQAKGASNPLAELSPSTPLGASWGTSSNKLQRLKGGLLARFDITRPTVANEEDLRKNPPLCEYWAHGKRALQGGGITKFASMTPEGHFEPLLFSASGDTTVKIWVLGKSENLTTLRGHRASVTDLVVNQDLPELFSASTDTTIIMWVIDQKVPEESRAIKTFRGHDSIITGMVVLPLPAAIADMQQSANYRDPRAESKLVSCSRDGTVRMWDLPQFELAMKNTNAMEQEITQDTSKGGTVIYHAAVSISSVVLHVTRDQSGKISDANVVTSASNGSMQYLDIFPTPQLQIEYRSAKIFELMSPLIDWFAFTYQKLIFVIPLLNSVIRMNLAKSWDDQDTVAKMGGDLDQATSQGVTSFFSRFLGDRSERELYFIELRFFLCCALIVVLAMSCRLYSGMQFWIDKYMSKEEYMEESASATSLAVLQKMKEHNFVKKLDSLRRGMWMGLWAIKFLTLPLMIHVYPMLDCLTKEDGKFHLEIQNDTICWQGDHLWQAIVTSCIVVVYLLNTIPFTFCGCDAEAYYTSRDFKDLVRTAGLRAVKVDISAFTPSGINWCFNQLMELFVKASLPGIAVLFNKYEFKRAAYMTCVIGLEFLVAWLVPAIRDNRCNLLVVALKFWVFFVFGVATYAGWEVENFQAVPGWALPAVLGGGTAFIILVVQIQFCISWYSHANKDQRMLSSTSTLEESAPFLPANSGPVA